MKGLNLVFCNTVTIQDHRTMDIQHIRMTSRFFTIVQYQHKIFFALELYIKVQSF